MGFCFCATEEEEEETPQYLDDPRRHSQVEELVGQLSRIIPPVDVAWTDAVVNTSALPSAQQPGRPQSPLGAFERRHSMSLQGQGRPPLATPPPSGMPPSPFAGQQQQQAQQAPGGGAGASFSGPALQWTDSRKLLEAAIAMEQLQPIPESGSGGGGGWGGGWDGGALQVAEQRLQARLFKLKLEHSVQEGDGNCQFRSISFGLFGTPRHHGWVRRKVVAYMASARADFEAFLGEEFGPYLRQMSRPGTWGDELTLRAACEALAVVVNVITSDDANWFLRYIPRTTRPQHETFLTYIAPIHYNALKRQNTGDRLRHSFGRQGSQLARAVSTYQRRYGIPETPQHVVAAAMAGG